MSEKIVAIVPLNNFDSNVESLDLDDRINLRRASEGEIQKLKESFPDIRGHLKIALQNVKYVLEWNALVWIDDKPAIVFGHLSPEVTDTILALRLLKSGDVTVSCGFALDKNGIYGLSGPSLPPMLPIPSGNTYFLKEEEISSFIILWKKLQYVHYDKLHLKFPLEQFTRTFEGYFGEEKIVGYMTAFESLLFHKIKKPIPKPIGKAMGIAVGMLLGNNQNERLKIRDTFETAYEIRNLTVHGEIEGLKKKYGKELLTIPMNIEDYLRRVLRKFVEE